jgi:hypothetical protein
MQFQTVESTLFYIIFYNNIIEFSEKAIKVLLSLVFLNIANCDGIELKFPSH